LGAKANKSIDSKLLKRAEDQADFFGWKITAVIAVRDLPPRTTDTKDLKSLLSRIRHCKCRIASM
jgi:hypothetical protein